MPATLQSIESLIPFLQFLAGAGAGIVGAWLFDQLRDRLEDDSPLAFLLAPFYARIAVMLFTFLIGTGASVALAFITGADVPGVLDASVAGFLSLVAAQLTHAITSLPKTPPEVIYVEFEESNGDKDTHLTPSA